MYRTFVILRHTFKESIVQPVYSVCIAVAAAILVVFALLPFFTFGEETLMYKTVVLDVVLLFVLIATLFATSRSIYDEIEDRTMLTLMSKPLRKWEVLVGKYLGIVLAALLAVAILGGVMCLCTWLRAPGDAMLNADSLNDLERKEVLGLREMHVAGLLPSLVLVWLQISVLAAIGVALSTRVSLVVNLPVVILIYIAGNLTRFISFDDSQPLWARVVGQVAASVLPFLQIFDLRHLAVLKTLKVAQYASDVTAVPVKTLWEFVARAASYAIAYAALALAAGLWLFHGRELGGAEG